jgi:hypothetical protein
MAIAECGLPNELDASRLSAWFSFETLACTDRPWRMYTKQFIALFQDCLAPKFDA